MAAFAMKSIRDQYYKTLFRPKSFFDNFISSFVTKFRSKATCINLYDNDWQLSWNLLYKLKFKHIRLCTFVNFGRIGFIKSTPAPASLSGFSGTFSTGFPFTGSSCRKTRWRRARTSSSSGCTGRTWLRCLTSFTPGHEMSDRLWKECLSRSDDLFKQKKK
jgi:hypothetical protein